MRCGRAQGIAREVCGVCKDEHRQLEPRLPRHPRRRAALARCRRDDRQGLDQSARGARAPRRSHGRALCAGPVAARARARRRSVMMAPKSAGLTANWGDVWLLDGVRTPFADYNGALARAPPTDLGIKAAREVFARSGVSPRDVGAVITGSMAQASFDTYCLPRHVGLYSDVPIEVPAHMVQRVCGPGLEVLMQAADFVTHKEIELTLCVGAESMSRNPVASYTMRDGFRMGGVDFKDFLWEALRDPAADVSMGDTAENLARQYQITRGEVDAFAAQSFERAVAAQTSGFLAGEIAPIKNETFERPPYQPGALKRAGLKLSDIDRFEINEAFGAQVMACARELGIDEAKLNVNGGAIAIGHPLGATGVRLALTLARELKRARLRYGVAAACIGGRQGIALLVENPDLPPPRKN